MPRYDRSVKDASLFVQYSFRELGRSGLRHKFKSREMRAVQAGTPCKRSHATESQSRHVSSLSLRPVSGKVHAFVAVGVD